MTNRIAQKFAALKSQNRKALITFIMSGDGGDHATRALLKGLPAAGADIIELGMPFSDPMADGPVIEAAGHRALAQGITLKDILAMVADFRTQDDATPIILMGYYNPIYAYGVEAFCADASKAGVDGMILVDLPPEEEEEFTRPADANGIDLIRLVAPTSLGARLPVLLKRARGFVYYISVTGITGGKAADLGALEEQVAAIKAQTNLPVAVGFGIKTPAQVAEVSRFADAVVVGSALVEKAAKDGVESALGFVSSLRA